MGVTEAGTGDEVMLKDIPGRGTDVRRQTHLPIGRAARAPSRLAHCRGRAIGGADLEK